MDRTGKYIDGTRQEKSRFGEPECGQTGGKKTEAARCGSHAKTVLYLVRLK